MISVNNVQEIAFCKDTVSINKVTDFLWTKHLCVLDDAIPEMEQNATLQSTMIMYVLSQLCLKHIVKVMQ